MLQLVVDFVQEFLCVNNNSLVSATADFTGFVKCLDFEGDNLAIHSGDSSLCPNIQTHGGGRDVLDIQCGAHSGLALCQCFFNGFAGSAFHQCHHAGGSVNQQAAGTDFLGGIFPLYGSADFTFHANCNFHMYHDLST